MQAIKNRGFTLIELLVVIAIIGILASVVLASLNTARDAGADAAAVSSINNARAQAELYYAEQSPNSYEGVCAAAATNSGIAGNIASAEEQLGADNVDCADSDDGYTITGERSDGTVYCVDSTGASIDAAAQVADDAAWVEGTHACANLS